MVRLPMSVLVHLLLLLLLSMQRSRALTLRVRLPTGLITRINVDDNSTLADLTVAVSSQCTVQASDSITLGDSTCSFADLQANQTSVAGAQLTRTSLLTITSSKTLTVGADAGAGAGAGPTAESVSSSLDSPSSSSSPPSKSATKRSFSVADLDKRRESLIKIKRQPANTSVEVQVSEQPQRIVARVGKSGGVAVLLGRLRQAPPSTSRRRQTQKTSETETEVVQVLGALEVSVGGACLTSGLLDEVGAVVAQKAQAMADALGLQVVGCCLGRGRGRGNSTSAGGIGGEGGEGGMWSAQHIHVVLQLRAATAGAALPLASFLVLR
jgi:hypothetical protein